MLVFLVFEVVLGVRAVHFQITSQTAQFMRLCEEENDVRKKKHPLSLSGCSDLYLTHPYNFSVLPISVRMMRMEMVVCLLILLLMDQVTDFIPLYLRDRMHPSMYQPKLLLTAAVSRYLSYLSSLLILIITIFSCSLSLPL